MAHPSKIGKQATVFFLKIIEMLGDKQHLKINNGSHTIMPLDVELVSDNIETPWGIGKEISFAHYYEQNGDLMRDPEITFLFVDNRKLITEKPLTASVSVGDLGSNLTLKASDVILDMVGVWPMSYTQDNLGVYQHIIREINKENVKFVSNQSFDAAQFCTQWFRNIKIQQKL